MQKKTFFYVLFTFPIFYRVFCCQFLLRTQPGLFFFYYLSRCQKRIVGAKVLPNVLTESFVQAPNTIWPTAKVITTPRLHFSFLSSIYHFFRFLSLSPAPSTPINIGKKKTICRFSISSRKWRISTSGGGGGDLRRN